MDTRLHSGQRETKAPKSGFGEWTEVLFFYLLPFLLFNGILFVLVAAKPQITIQVANTKDYKTTTATITIQSLFPIKEFTSSQEGTELPLTETKKGQYTADIVCNGVIEIFAKGLNGMTVTKYEHVNILDDVAPLVGETYSIQDGILSMALEDSQSGVDFQSVFAVTPSGQTLTPLSVDRQTGVLTFPMEEELLVIYANDLAGNGMQATFSTHIETLQPGQVPATQYPLEAGVPGTENTASVEAGTASLTENTVPGGENPENFAAETAEISGTEPLELPNQTEPIPTQQPLTEQTQTAETQEEIMIHIRTHE